MLGFWKFNEELGNTKLTQEQIQEKLQQLIDSLPKTNQEKRDYLEKEYPEKPPEDFE